MTEGVSASVVRGLDTVPPSPSVVTIGNFDGVHRGHQVLLRRTSDAAIARGVRAVAITFDPHPAAVLRPGSEPPTLGGIEERTERLLDTGMDLVVVLEFTTELSQLSPGQFVELVLFERLQAARVVVGTNFRFGHKAAGDVVSLLDAGELHGFDVEAVALRNLADGAISSSAIREALMTGDLGWATEALGRPYTLRGQVVRGDGRGRTIGIPTANVAVSHGQVVPANGVYAGHASVGDRTWPCVTNVGTRPTFGAGDQRAVEAHLLDVDEELDLYGQLLEVSFEHRLRDEQRFDSVDQLVGRIRADVEDARSRLAADQR